MTDTLFSLLYDAMSGPVWLVLLASFGWGVLSILLSPCHLSSVPLVVGFISAQGPLTHLRTFIISFVFAAGILLTIAVIGAVTASMGRLMGDVGSVGQYIVAAVFLGVGLHMMDVITLDWNTAGLRRTALRGLPAAFALGLLFGIALGPCTFAYMAPVLGIAFQSAQTDPLWSLLLILSFGIGHCAVIVAAGTLTTAVQRYVQWSDSSRTLVWIRRVCGALVVAGGIYLIATTL